jgi:hypothetical protein
MAKVPSRLHAAAEDALKLTGGDAFLGTAKQVDGLKPQPQRKVAVLENRANADCEGLTAGVALPQANAGRFALKSAELGLIRVLTMRANGTVRPKLRFNVSEGRYLIVKPCIGQNRFGDGQNSYG